MLGEKYNLPPISASMQMDARTRLAEEKLANFMKVCAKDVKILSPANGAQIIPTVKDIKLRYGCVFRESGNKLKVSCLKRYFFEDPNRPEPTICIDFEKHESLVRPRPGPKFDGSMGTVGPATQYLVVLYKVERNQVQEMYISPDMNKVGEDPNAGETVLDRMELMQAFFKVVKKIIPNHGKPHFNNYHKIETIG